MPAKKRSRRPRRAGKAKQLHPPAHWTPHPLKGVERAILTPEPQTEALKAATDFDERYAYVLSDLKRIGTLAGALFLVLIILSFILR